MSCVIIYPGLPLPAASSDLPENVTGRHIVFDPVLLRMGFTCAPAVTSRAVVSYTALPPLPGLSRHIADSRAVHFCCTVLGVASTRRYLASCPVKPGLSSSAAFRPLQLRPSVLLKTRRRALYFQRLTLPHFFPFVYYTLKQLPPTNSRRIEF